jgi:hypothetical protein
MLLFLFRIEEKTNMKRFDHRITKQMCLVKFSFLKTRDNNIVVKQNKQPKEYKKKKKK